MGWGASVRLRCWKAKLEREESVEGSREDVDAEDMSAEGEKGGGCRKPDAR
jgi:hypothetical protein